MDLQKWSRLPISGPTVCWLSTFYIPEPAALCVKFVLMRPLDLPASRGQTSIALLKREPWRSGTGHAHLLYHHSHFLLFQWRQLHSRNNGHERQAAHARKHTRVAACSDRHHPSPRARGSLRPSERVCGGKKGRNHQKELLAKNTLWLARSTTVFRFGMRV